jgi:hypothetical protein
VSTSIGSGYATSITVGVSGNISSTTVYVRIAATSTVASSPYSGNIVLSSADATNVNVATISSTVSAKAITVIGLTALDKDYDGNTSVSVSGTSSLSGVVGSDVVILGGTPAYAFATATAGTNKTINTIGYSISGADAGNYSLTQPALTATINKINQTITALASPISKTYGDATYSVATTSNSGLTVTYSSSNTAVATVASNGTVTITGAGSTTITASQAGNVNYNAASDVTQSLTVAKANQTITFNALVDKLVTDIPFALTATASSGLSVTYTSSNTAVATVSGSTVTIVGAGTTTITASQAGNVNYNAASDVARTQVVVPVSIATDYFRSKASGDWNSASTWQTSADGISWINSTLIPNSTANTISIRTGDSVYVAAAVSVDQVVVNSGATLNSTSGLTVVNGTGDDISIENGGKIIYKAGPTYSSSTIRVKAGGVLSIQGSGLTANGAGVNATTHIYDDASVLEWNLSTGIPSSSGVTFFPNNNASTVAIFRFASGISSATFGGASQTTFNGKLEVASGISLTLGGTATKTIRDGVIGTGTLNQGSAGQLIFSGTTSVIGGTATVNLGTSGLSVIGALDITGNLVCGTNVVSGAGSVAVSNGGTIKLGSVSASGAIAGNITATGGLTLNSGSTVEYNGAAAQKMAARTFSNVTINNSTGVSLLGDVSIDGTLDLTSGIIATSTNKIILNNAASVSRTSGHVNGNLRRYVPTGTVTSFVLPLGDATNYTPASLDFAGTVTGTGYLDATVSVPGAAPAVASGLNQTKYANRKWTITNTGVTGFSSFGTTFTFVSGDVLGSANSAYFVI